MHIVCIDCSDDVTGTMLLNTSCSCHHQNRKICSDKHASPKYNYNADTTGFYRDLCRKNIGCINTISLRHCVIPERPYCILYIKLIEDIHVCDINSNTHYTNDIATLFTTKKKEISAINMLNTTTKLLLKYHYY